MKFTEILYAMQHKQLVEQIDSDATDADRPRLTLRHIQALRKLRDQQAIERDAHREFVHIMYADPEEDDSEKTKQNDQWQRKQSKAAMRAIKAKQKEHEKNAKEVQDDIKERRKKAATVE